MHIAATKTFVKGISNMAKKNDGKKFEKVIQEAFEKVPGVSIDRLRDAPTHFRNVDNPSDFVAYKKPHEMYIECKSHHGNTLPFSCIRPAQISKMLVKERIEGVKCGFIVWYIDREFTLWYPVETVAYIQMLGRKSLHYKDQFTSSRILRIFGKKKRNSIFYNYDIERFLDELFKEDENEQI